MIVYVKEDITKEEKEIGSWYQKGATGWGDAITIIPWTLYRHYGNIDVLKNCQKFINYQ